MVSRVEAWGQWRSPMGNMKSGSGHLERGQEQHRNKPMRQQQQQQGSRQGDANQGGRSQSHSNQADQTDETGGGLGRGRNR